MIAFIAKPASNLKQHSDVILDITMEKEILRWTFVNYFNNADYGYGRYFSRGGVADIVAMLVIAE